MYLLFLLLLSISPPSLLAKAPIDKILFDNGDDGGLLSVPISFSIQVGLDDSIDGVKDVSFVPLKLMSPHDAMGALFPVLGEPHIAGKGLGGLESGEVVTFARGIFSDEFCEETNLAHEECLDRNLVFAAGVYERCVYAWLAERNERLRRLAEEEGLEGTFELEEIDMAIRRNEGEGEEKCRLEEQWKALEPQARVGGRLEGVELPEDLARVGEAWNILDIIMRDNPPTEEWAESYGYIRPVQLRALLSAIDELGARYGSRRSAGGAKRRLLISNFLRTSKASPVQLTAFNSPPGRTARLVSMGVTARLAFSQLGQG